MASKRRLEWEAPIYELEDVLARLEAGTNSGLDNSEEIRRIRRELVSLRKKIYSNLTAWQTVEVSRHEERPQTMDYIELIFEQFVELHGDRAIGDDRAIRCGFARLGDFRIMLIGHQKGHTFAERRDCFFGCAHPEGYRKALKNMELAAKFRLPVICLIDTGFGGPSGNSARRISSDVYFPLRRTTILPSSSSHSITDPGPIPSLLRTSAGTEICPCAVIFDRAIAMPHITTVMHHSRRGAPLGACSVPFGMRAPQFFAGVL